jgi:hypothetical protein
MIFTGGHAEARHVFRTGFFASLELALPAARNFGARGQDVVVSRFSDALEVCRLDIQYIGEILFFERVTQVERSDTG